MGLFIATVAVLLTKSFIYVPTFYMSLIGGAVLFLTLYSSHFLNFVYQLPLMYGVLCLFVAAVIGFDVIFVYNV